MYVYKKCHYLPAIELFDGPQIRLLGASNDHFLGEACHCLFLFFLLLFLGFVLVRLRVIAVVFFFFVIFFILYKFGISYFAYFYC